MGEATRIAGTTTYEWVLGGRFVQCRGTRKPEKIENLQIIGFDPATREYRHWYFDSFGTVAGPMKGQWSDSEKTLTWQGNLLAGARLVNRVHFIGNDTMEWQMAVLSKAGEVYFEQEGKSRRKANEGNP